MRGIEKVDLKYSKSINPQFGTVDQSLRDRSYVINFKSGKLVLDKSIRVYDFWFRFLKLGVELETHNYKVRGIGNGGLVPIKVNRKFYKDWGLDSILDYRFEKWISEYRDLFRSKDVSLVKEITNTSNYHYVQIDKSLGIRKVLPLLRNIYSELPKPTPNNKKDYFVPKNNHRSMSLHIYYNVFIWLRTLDLQREDLRELLEKKYEGYFTLHRKKKETKKIKLPNDESSLRRLIRMSEQTLLDVCNGDF